MDYVLISMAKRGVLGFPDAPMTISKRRHHHQQADLTEIYVLVHLVVLRTITHCLSLFSIMLWSTDLVFQKVPKSSVEGREGKRYLTTHLVLCP